jgi:predicted RNase H-like HicB family nuclease
LNGELALQKAKEVIQTALESENESVQKMPINLMMLDQ